MNWTFDASNIESNSSDKRRKCFAFCSISTGVFNFPQELAAEIAIDTVTDYLNSNETTLKCVVFDVFSNSSYLTYKKLLFGEK